MHLASALPRLDYACELAEFDHLYDDPYEGLEIVNGMIHVPDTVGSGVALRKGPGSPPDRDDSAAGTKQEGGFDAKHKLLRPMPLVLAVAMTAFSGLAANYAVAQDAAAIDKIAMYKGADREKMLIEGAKKEGTVTFYSTLTINQALRPLVAGFQKKYPFMKVRYSRDNPPEMLQKLSAEARANNYVTDVYESTALEVPARKADINRPFYSPEAAVYPAERKSPKGYYVRRATAISASATTPTCQA